MTILETIERKNFIVSDHDVELLAASHLEHDTQTKRTDGHYLRILCASTKAQFGNGHTPRPGRRKLTSGDMKAMHDFVAALHARLYVFVMKGVTTPEVADDEALAVDVKRARAAVRNSRATFARTAASTVLGFIRTGGDLRAVDVDTVTKAQLREATLAVTAPEQSPRARAVFGSLKRFTKAAIKLAATHPDDAREALERAMRELSDVLDGLDHEVHATRPEVGVESGIFQRTRGNRFRHAAEAA